MLSRVIRLCSALLALAMSFDAQAQVQVQVQAHATATATATATAAAAADSAVPRGAAGRLVAHYRMQRIPLEGAWFSLAYQSSDVVDGTALPARYGGRQHAAGSSIIGLETADDFSALHRLRTDEVWHFYGGSPIELLLLFPDGHGQKVILGGKVLAGELPQYTVPRGVWQGSAPLGRARQRYSLFGTQLSPAFDYEDFEMGYRDALQEQYPAFAGDIERLTRAQFDRNPQASEQNPAASALPAPSTRAPPGAVSSAADTAAQTMSDGVDLRELVGRVASTARTDRVSIAQFKIAPGRSTGTSYNRVSQEVFWVIDGSGKVHLGNRIESVGAGSTVFIPAQLPHSIESDPQGSLSFLAISAPAFAPEDYVVLNPQAGSGK